MLQKKHILFIIVLNVLLAAWMIGQSEVAELFQAAPKSSEPIADSYQTILQDSWTFYKGRFLKDGSHVVSNTYGGTISEGQSYAMLKAVWMDDPATFRRVWEWTKKHMARPQDSLPGWHWGQKEDGSEGLLQMETATDADQDIAYALLLAGEKWNEPSYIEDAKTLIRDLWAVAVRQINGKYYLMPGDWEGFFQEYQTMAPAYFAPYIYHRFAEVDPEHADGWRQLANDIYDTLEACSNLTANKLPPNWCAVTYVGEGETPQIVFSDKQGSTSRDFGYDSFRVYWRMAMDAKLSPSPGRERAKTYLQRHHYLLTYWQFKKRIPEGFSPDGKPLGNANSGFTMGPLLITAEYNQPSATQAIYRQTLAKHYNPEGYWFNDYNDYLHSVIWLHLYGLALQ